MKLETFKMHATMNQRRTWRRYFPAWIGLMTHSKGGHKYPVGLVCRIWNTTWGVWLA